MLSISDIKVGTIFKYQDAPYKALSVSHSKQARSAAVLTTKMKNLISGQVLERNFKSSDKFEEAEITRKKVNFLYHEGKKKYYFMDEVEYDQFFLEFEVVGDKAKFLTESLTVNILYYNNQVIGLELPPKVEIKVTQAPEGVRGDTTGSATKSVDLETGYTLNVPLFIKQDDVIRVNTETGEYVERV